MLFPVFSQYRVIFIGRFARADSSMLNTLDCMSSSGPEHMAIGVDVPPSWQIERVPQDGSVHAA